MADDERPGAPGTGPDAPDPAGRTPDDDRVSVAELLRRLGHRDQPRRRRALDDEPAGTPPVAPGDGAAPPPGAVLGSTPLGSTPLGAAALDAPTTRIPRLTEDELTRPPALDVPPAPEPSPATQPPTTQPPTAAPGPAVPPLPASRLPALSATAVPSLVRAAGGATRLQSKRARRDRRSRVAGKTLVTAVAFVVFLATGAAWAGTTYLDSQINQVGALDEGSSAIVDGDQQYGDENYLLVGSDTRAGTNGEIGAGTTEEAGGARSDTVMLAHVPADRSRVVIVSFPRDLQVDRPECQVWDNTTASYTAETDAGETDSKLNAAYGIGGPKCLVKVIQQISGLSINHFVGIDFSGFQKMVDEVGGVEVCSETPLVDDELGTILATPGTQLVDGTTALNYVRARKVEAEGNGDYGRIQRQQRFLSSLLRTALSNKVLFDPGKLSGFVREFTAATYGDGIGFESLLTLGESLQGLDAGRVTFLTTPTTGTSYDGNEIQDRAGIAAIFRAVIDDQPLPGEAGAAEATTTAPTTTPAPSLAALDPALVGYGILNATQTGGLATQTGDQLAAFGFGLPLVADNYGSESATTFVQYSAGQEAAAQTLASTVPGATTQLVEGLGTQVDLVIGTDYTGTVVAPTAAGSPLAAAPAPAATALPPNLAVVNGADSTCR